MYVFLYNYLIEKNEKRAPHMLEVSNFTKIYQGSTPAVDNLSLSVAAGEIFGFIGHNGAGKSTTIKAIAGILSFEQGTITINGHSIQKEPVACKQAMAYIPDNPDLYAGLSGIGYLNFIGDVYGVPADTRKGRIEEYAGLLELTDALGDSISSYSHGMRQKLVIISALLHAPKLLVLDEPFVGLDPKAMLTLRQILRALCDNGSAVLFSTHVLEVAEKLCDTVGIIKGGKMVAMGPMQEVRGDVSLEDVFMELTDHA
jgi:ABC-2 type transport system ATP-binding protein